MKKILLGFILFLPIIASATNFPQSGIDYDISTMTITGPLGAKCLTQPISPSGHAFSLTQLGFEDSISTLDTFGDWSIAAQQCFQAAGDYNLDIELFDLAGNASDVLSEEFHITSDTPNEEASSFSVMCSSGATANNVDDCSVDLTLQDKFGNFVQQAMPTTTIFAPLGAISGDANLGIGFREGLRVGGLPFLTALSFPWDGITPSSLSITALAPTIEEVDLGITTLSSIVARSIDFQVNNMRSIALNGLITATPVSFTDLSASFLFKPIEIVPGFEQTTIALGTDDTIEMNNILYVSSPGLIDDVISNFTSISDHIFMDTPEDITGGLLNENVFFEDVINEETKLVGKIIYPGDQYDTPEDISLTTIANYTFGTTSIRYPAGATGEPIADALIAAGYSSPLFPSIVGWNEFGVGMKNIGMSVEGTVAGNTDEMYLVGGDDNNITALSSTHEMDIREEIIKNSYRLVRNAADIKDDVSIAFDWSEFAGVNEKDVIVYDLSDKTGAATTLTLTAHNLPLGKKTLIVLNGNVLITGDLTYSDPAISSFGLVLLRDEAGPQPVLGNIFVKSSVQKINGTLFADGGFFSGDTVSLTNANTDNGSNNRSKQLLLLGTLFAKNTIGGSRRVDATGDYFTPWGTTSTKDIAKRYDLHEIRNYDSDVDPANCVGHPTCDPNNAAFVLRMDGKVNLASPPGFRTQNTH